MLSTAEDSISSSTIAAAAAAAAAVATNTTTASHSHNLQLICHWSAQERRHVIFSSLSEALLALRALGSCYNFRAEAVRFCYNFQAQAVLDLILLDERSTAPC